MVITLDPEQLVSSDELPMSQAVQQEAFTRLVIEKGIFSKEEFWEMVKRIDQEMRGESEWN